MAITYSVIQLLEKVARQDIVLLNISIALISIVSLALRGQKFYLPFESSKINGDISNLIKT